MDSIFDYIVVNSNIDTIQVISDVLFETGQG